MQSLIDKIQSFNLTANFLAEKSGLTVDRILGILDDQIEPSMGEIRKIAKALKVSPNLLINDGVEIPELGILFRKSFANDDKSTITRLSYIINNSLTIITERQPKSEFLNIFPNVENTFEDAKKLAEIFRKEFFRSDFVSPILNLPTIVAEKLGCVVLIQELGNEHDGASVIHDGIPFIIICPRFLPRMLFTLAHELGHILAHHKERTFAKIDGYEDSLRKKKSGDEAFAHAFASELLMPQEGIGIALKTIRRILKIDDEYIGEVELLFLARIYGVSFETAALRCENLGLMPVGSSVSLYEALVREYKNPEARARDLGLPEREMIKFPRVSSNLFNAAIKKIRTGEISLEKASELLSISAVDIVNYHSSHEWI